MFWNSLGVLAVQGGTFLTQLVVANLLGAESFGQFGLVIATATTVGGVMQFSTGMAANRYLSEFRERDRERASIVLGVCGRISLLAGVAGTMLLLLGATPIASHLLDAAWLREELMLVSPIAFCTILMGFQNGVLVGLEGYRRATGYFFVLMLIQVAGVAYAAQSWGLSGALGAMALNMGLRTAVCAWLVERDAGRFRLERRFVWNEFSRELCTRFLLPGSVIGLTAMPAMWIASVGLSRSAGGFEQLAYFHAAFAVRAVLLVFPSILNSVGLSFLSGQGQTGDTRMFDRILLACLGLTSGSVLLGAAGAVLFGEQILGSYGPGFAAATEVLWILLLSLLAEALVIPLYQALASRDQLWRTYLCAMLPRDLTFAGLGLLLGMRHGAVGLASAHLAAWLVGLFAITILVLRERTGRNLNSSFPA